MAHCVAPKFSFPRLFSFFFGSASFAVPDRFCMTMFVSTSGFFASFLRLCFCFQPTERKRAFHFRSVKRISFGQVIKMFCFQHAHRMAKIHCKYKRKILDCSNFHALSNGLGIFLEKKRLSCLIHKFVNELHSKH